MNYFLRLCLVITILKVTNCQEDDNGPYQGSFIGKLNSYHHQVSGDVYAVDEFTLLLKNFKYDGQGGDTFFWAGDANRPGPQGFIVPDQHGKTNILDRYLNADFTLLLPDGKKITKLKWFAVYDISTQNVFGDLQIPEDFEPPAPQVGGSFVGKSHGVGSGPVQFADSKTVIIPEFSYDGQGRETYFWIGVGPQPSSKGFKVPDESGYLDPIKAYNREQVKLTIPGEKTLFDINWISVYDVATKENFGSILIPESLNIPPSLVQVNTNKTSLPNCVQLHKELQVAWEVFGPQITIELSGQVGEKDYISFGISGSQEQTEMLGADIAVAYIDGYTGFAKDYNISALAPCVKVLGQYKGVCPDANLGGQDNYQVNSARRVGDINTISYRRILKSSEPLDLDYNTDSESFFVWALGTLDHNKEPTFHYAYPRKNVVLNLGSKEPINTCFAFTSINKNLRPAWDKMEIFDGAIRTFTATIGPSGGTRGYSGITGQPSNGLAWYINGLLAPEIWLRRGLTYSFKVFGGNNPHSPTDYHPFIITADSHGGFDQLSDSAQQNVRVFAGVQFTRRGRPTPTAVGPLCKANHPKNRDRRLDDDFATFKKYNRSLEFKCESGNPGILEITPNTSWPDVVYYNSFTHSNMGWKINVVDRYGRNDGFISSCNVFLIGLSVLFCWYR